MRRCAATVTRPPSGVAGETVESLAARVQARKKGLVIGALSRVATCTLKV
jgi:hypothetical protein